MYGMVFDGMAIGFFLILEWTLREGRTVPPVPPERRWAARARFAPRILGYSLVVGSAFISPLLALGLLIATVVFYAFEQTPLRASGRISARPDGTDNE
jgi:hypothetical protein